MSGYSLRKFDADVINGKYKNETVGIFKKHPSEPSCYIFEDVPKQHTSLQLYPMNDTKQTLYTLLPGQVIHVYGYSQSECQLYAKTCEHDSYLYFKPQHPHVIVVVKDVDDVVDDKWVLSICV